jgi:hypothetical protein
VPDVPSVEELPVLPAAELAVRLAEAYRLTGQVGLTAQVERLSARVEELERQARKDSSTSSRPPSSDSRIGRTEPTCGLRSATTSTRYARGACLPRGPRRPDGGHGRARRENRARLPPAPDLGLSTAQAALIAELQGLVTEPHGCARPVCT